MDFQIWQWNRQREAGILGSQTTVVLLLVLLGTNEAKTKRGWSPTEVAGQPAGGRGKARPQGFSSKCTAFNVTKVSLPQASFATGPAKTHSPIQFSRFHVAEAVRFRAGQQQDVSLFETKHTNNTERPRPPRQNWAPGQMWGQGMRQQSLSTYWDEIIFFQTNDISDLNLFPLGNFEPKY